MGPFTKNALATHACNRQNGGYGRGMGDELVRDDGEDDESVRKGQLPPP